MRIVHVDQAARTLAWLTAGLLLALPAVTQAQTATGVGFAPITIPDPVNGGTMPGLVFYPSADANGVTWVGSYELHATRNAPAISGAKPLVVIAHGHGGSDLGHHDLAVYLAGHGFVTATLQFPKDNFRDTSGDGTAQVLIGRPIQVKATINFLLADSHWSKLIDPDQIGVAGFSAGGYTALMLVGAVPIFDRIVAYCKRHPSDRQTCAPKLWSTLLRNSGQPSRKAYAEALQKQLFRWGNTDDPRVKAAFAMAPFGVVFNRTGLTAIKRPVYLYDGADDQFQPVRYNTLYLAPLIKTLVGIKLIPGAGHFVFLAPCSAKLAKAAPRICTDPPGASRVAAHRQINADALAFFRGTLHVLPEH